MDYGPNRAKHVSVQLGPDSSHELLPKTERLADLSASLGLKQPKREHIALCRDSNVLLAIHHVCHWRGEQTVASRKVPQVLPGPRVDRHQVAIVIPGENDAARGGDCARPHDARAGHRKFPLNV